MGVRRRRGSGGGPLNGVLKRRAWMIWLLPRAAAARDQAAVRRRW